MSYNNTSKIKISKALLAMTSGFAREASYEDCSLAVASHATRRGER